MNIALCGMMGCGKTTIAKIISEKCDLQLLDTDAIIVENHGVIADIFAKKGEGYFREIEADTIAKYCTNDGNFVIALGGGAVLREENVQNLKKCGKLIYLRTKPENLLKRLENTDDRPLLNGTMRDKVYGILSVRSPIYERVADKIIDTDDVSPEFVADKILESIK